MCHFFSLWGTTQFSPNQSSTSGISFNSQLSWAKLQVEPRLQTPICAENAPEKNGGEWFFKQHGVLISSTQTSWRSQKVDPDPNWPDWLLVAEGRMKSPEPKIKADLSFPLAPQCPGKGGWPCRKLNLVDSFWGGSKDIGKLLSPMSHSACLPENLERWKHQSFEV